MPFRIGYTSRESLATSASENSLRQRRELDRDDRESIVEVLSKPAIANGLIELIKSGLIQVFERLMGYRATNNLEKLAVHL